MTQRIGLLTVLLFGLVAAPLMAGVPVTRPPVAHPPMVEVPGGQDAKPEESGPSFKTEKAQLAYAEGMKLYGEGDYKGADKAFKKAYSGAKKKADKDVVKSWRAAIKYIPSIKRAELLFQQGRYGDCGEFLEKLRIPVSTTPAIKEWTALATQLEAAVYVPIESFDFKSPSYTEKYGKFFISDKRVVLKGAGCYRWKSMDGGKVAQLKIKNVPKNWQLYDAVEFWMQSPGNVPIEALIMTDKDQKKGPGLVPPPVGAKKLQAAFQTTVKVTGKVGTWRRYRVRLSTFGSQGGATLAGVNEFLLQVRGGTKFDVFIDELRLVKGDPKREKPKARSRR